MEASQQAKQCGHAIFTDDACLQEVVKDSRYWIELLIIIIKISWAGFPLEEKNGWENLALIEVKIEWEFKKLSESEIYFQ